MTRTSKKASELLQARPLQAQVLPARPSAFSAVLGTGLRVAETLFAWVRTGFWAYRLRVAREYRTGLEHVMRVERMKAQHDVEYCEVMHRRAEMATVTARADAKLRGL